MPKYRRKSGGRCEGDRGQMGGINDVTVYDFAHSEASPKKTTCRMKKGAVKNALQSEVKQLVGCVTQDVGPLAWYEKDLDDFNIVGNENDAEYEDVNGDLVVRTETKKVTAKKAPQTNTENIGRYYPLDLWFLLSDYVDPEDVGRFALICTSSHYVTHTAQFWKRLYKRHYDSTLKLPPQFQKTSMERLHGLRARVIRALQMMHQPFIERYRFTGQPFEDDVYLVEGYRCTMMWYENYKHYWNFYFKLKLDLLPSCGFLARIANKKSTQNSPQRGQKQYDLINGFNDIHDNQTHGCCILKAVCKNYCSFPVIMGMVLNKVFLNVSQNMQFHRLRLVFDTHRVTDIRQCCTGITVELDPVLNARVLNWWDPKFPTFE